MAILKIIDKPYVGENAEKCVYEYIMEPVKTYDITGGYNVYKEYYLNIAPKVRNLFSKNETHKFIHLIVSYKDQHEISEIYSDAMTIAMFFTGNQVVFGIHLNTAYQHIHFMVNNVRFTDGYVIKDYAELRRELIDYCNGRILERIL